jgi:FtsP/CotA-like multicopper oxidase with cupredoxin domain
MLVFAGSAQAGDCDLIQGPRIEDPPVFQWQGPYSGPGGSYWSGTLEIGKAVDLTIEGAPIGADKLTTRAYRQDPQECQADPKCGNFSIPGPTIKMTPGQTSALTFKNTLEFEQPSPVHNDLKDPNITNIHTHGLHVSGKTPADDITRLINGGFCGDYVYKVPADHMGGTLWYHAHHHGSTYLQVAAGAFGLLIVDDSNDGIPTAVAGMTEHQLAIGYLDPDVAGAGGDTLVSGTFSPTWTVNGLVGGSLCTRAGEWEHWRVLLADRDARMKTLSVGPECEVALLARDGVWRTVVPKELPTNSIELTGASRADLAVRCGADSTISVNTTTVATVVADDSELPSGNVGPYTTDVSNLDYPYWKLDRPSYLRDLRDPDVGPPVEVENRSINMGARTVNGKKFDVNVPTFSIPATSETLVQEWNIKGATQHPFHKHIYHVQMNGACGGGAFEDGEYYDTVAGNCLVRFDLNPTTSSVYDGITIMHCHILLHEDEGAMGWTDVQGGLAPPDFPDFDNRRVLYEQDVDGACVLSSCIPDEDPEVSCADGLDNDCDNLIDGADPDCSGGGGDQELCDDGIDNDGDGKIDCADKKDCNKDPACADGGGGGDQEICDDGIDNDGDGKTDCADKKDCNKDPAC